MFSCFVMKDAALRQHVEAGLVELFAAEEKAADPGASQMFRSGPGHRLPGGNTAKAEGVRTIRASARSPDSLASNHETKAAVAKSPSIAAAESRLSEARPILAPARKEETKAPRREKAEAGLATAREQEHQRTEEAGPELPRVQKPPGRKALQWERCTQAKKPWKKRQNEKTWSQTKPRSTCCAAGEGGRAGAILPKLHRHMCNGKLAGFAKAPGQEDGLQRECGQQLVLPAPQRSLWTHEQGPLLSQADKAAEETKAGEDKSPDIEDSGFATSPLCKVVIVTSLTLAWMVNLLLPIDVRNSRPGPGFLDMQTLWMAAFITVLVFLVLIVPAAMFYYEVEGDDFVKRKRSYVLRSLFLSFVFSAAFLGISFPFLSKASIPIVEYTCEDWDRGDATIQLGKICGKGQSKEIEIQVGFQIYIIAVLCFLGWFFLSVFGAVGLSAAPMDMIYAFIDRPRAIDEATYRQRRKLIGMAAGVLLQRAEELQTRDEDMAAQHKGASTSRFSVSGWRAGKQLRQVRTDYNRFKCDEFEKLQISKFQKGESLVVAILKLITGIIFAILSLAWILQIIICVLVPQITGQVGFGFLNDLFAACESSGLYPLGIALYASFNFYMLICVVQGCTKLGMRAAPP
eukprot:s99_g17.t1